MRIIVYYIAASRGGGGETILKQYFDYATQHVENEYWFFVSIPEYVSKESNNVHVVFLDVSRRSKLLSYSYRKAFEVFKLNRLVSKISPDEIISLQNVIAPTNRCRKQIVYLHQSFQFSPVRFSYFKREERSLAFRQTVICGIIRKKLNKADTIIVQTSWMREAVSKWANYPIDRIIVEKPVVSIPKVEASIDHDKCVFFYPASAYVYKNHKVIVEACRELKRQGIRGYVVEFTISPNDKRASELIASVQKDELPVNFIGHLGKKELFLKYQEAVMLFPSYIETFGLPLLEAREMDGTIIASNCPFSREVLDGYSKAKYAEWNSPNEWAETMKEYIISE